MTPPPRISVPDWADRYRFLAREAGSTSGRFRTSQVEIARGPMLAVTEPGVRTITVMCATQLLKTTLLENVFGFHAHLDPCPILLVQPKDDAAEAFSKERILPMIKATPVLRGLISSNRRKADKVGREQRYIDKEPENTLTFLRFPGGFLALTGAGSPDNLARRPVKKVLYDEIDKYAPTKEGNTLALGDERLATFTGGQSIRACSPTIEEESEIENSHAHSDQRKASVSCPHCSHRQFLDFFQHVDWEKHKDEAGETLEHLTGTAQLFCEACREPWSEGDRLRALQTIRWHQTRTFRCCGQVHSPLDAYSRAWRGGADLAEAPVDTVWDWWIEESPSPRWAVYRAKCPSCGEWGVSNDHAGFQAGKLYSPWDRDRPSAQARKWIDAQGDDTMLQAWWNTQQGLPHRPKVGREMRASRMLERREVWAGQVPAGAAVLTAAVDTQDDRLCLEVVAWGPGEESWSILYTEIEGDPDEDEVWQQLDEILQRPLYRADGRPFVIAATCVDSGGHHTQKVYAFCRARRNRKVWAIKGASERGGTRTPVWPPVKLNRKYSRDYKPVIIGTNAAKDRISACLQIDTSGPGYMHFPAERDAGYFAQLAESNRLVVKKVGGRSFRIWEKKRDHADEALDCRVYAYAALWGLIVMHKLDLAREAEKVGATETPVIRAGTSEAQRLEANNEAAPPPEAGSKDEKPKTRKRKIGKSNYLKGLGR